MPPITLSDALSAIAERKEFAIRRKDGLATINYLVQMPGTFDGIRADFRGITFDEETGECVSRPLHKFYGVGQTEETQFDRIKGENATIFEKLDGSLIHFLRHRGSIVAATRSGPGTPQALAAQEFAESRGLIPSIAFDVDSGFTPIFEYLSPRFPIVVRHPAERLVWLCSRDRHSGDYLLVSSYPDCAEYHTFPFADLMARLADRKDFEGFVCWLSSGMTVKAKCNWYLERHRAFDAMLRPAYRLYGLALDGAMDDLVAAAQPHHKGPLERVWAEASGGMLAERAMLDGLLERFLPVARQVDDPKLARKLFVEAIRQEYPGCLGPLMTMYDGKSPDKAIRSRLMERYRRMYPDPIIVNTEEDAS